VANAGAREVLEAFSRRGLGLALICNTGRTPGSMLRLVLDRLGLKGYLRVLTFSDEVGLRKPHPEIFRRTLAALGVSPSESAHVGDDLSTDVAGARAFGMRAIHLCHPTGASPHSNGAPSISCLADLPAALFGDAS
jgi:putative hydrolase of the HAD superfamily